MLEQNVKRCTPHTMERVQVAISTSPSAPVWDEAVATTSPSFPSGLGLDSSFMNESSSLSSSSAVFGFLGPGRGGLAPLVRTAPPPRGLRLKGNVRGKTHGFDD